MFSCCWKGLATAAVLVLPAAGAEPAAAEQAMVRLEAWPQGGKARISTAIAVGPALLATILPEAPKEEAWRAGADGGTLAVKLLARDAASGFTLLGPVAADTAPWKPLTLTATAAVPAPGDALELPGSPGTAARCAGRDILFQAQLLENPWLRVHLPQGPWTVGTPLSAGGTFAGIIAGPVPGVPDAARLLPARAVHHFVTLYTDRHTLTRPFLGLRLDQASALPLVRECYAALPAERAGIQPGDVLLRIGTTNITTATDAVEACFYLRVDDEVPIRVLRGTGMTEVKLKPVTATAAAQKSER